MPACCDARLPNPGRRQSCGKVVCACRRGSEVSANARVQVCLPNGELYDVVGIQLMENKIIGNRESHRLVITIDREKWTMGKVMKRV